MKLPVLLTIISVLLSSFPWQLHAQDLALTDLMSVVTTESAGSATKAMLSSEFATTSVDTDTMSALGIIAETTYEALSVLQASTTASLQTDRAAAAATEPTTPATEPTTPATEPTTPVFLSTTPEAPSMPLASAQPETTIIYVLNTTSAPVDQGTSPSPISPTPTAGGIIPTAPPTKPAMVDSTSTSTTPGYTPAVTTTAETIGTIPPAALSPDPIPVIPISSSPSSPETTTSRGTTDTSGTDTSGTDTSGTSTIRDPALVGGLSPVEGNQSDRSVWLWVTVAALLAVLASVACIALLIQRRNQKRESGLGHNGMNGHSQRSQKKRKKGGEDAWAGPVLMDGAEKDEGDRYNVDEEHNIGDGPADGTQLMLSTFAPSEDEETAVGADGTKEAKKWEEQAPLLYIDEDVEDEVDEGTPANQKRAAPSQEEQGTGRTQAEGSEAQKKGEAGSETGGALNGAVAFCQTTAV